ncbi:hypothetical protein V0R50_04565 [Pseudomonas sp. 148P]|uniref:Uncharacterized protein n=1 Tax=Pseudomonas ulcerans TaxID=3115852 RepID=A0ABU7HLS0_9PSED|nr:MULTISPECIES: hypothetical protein [unclassified Pseudomonas]MEE1921167.1 hypothetical protein [Pseudomonas sp. 147P]MEE1932484.1 hypothetical protein [Pseudomonas sp. 148P]
MKKIVPDPPYELCVGPNLSHNDAIQHAEKNLENALRLVKLLPEQAHLEHQHRLEDAILNLKISKAMLTLAQSKTPMMVPIE